MLENDESFSTKSLENTETMNPIPVLSFKTNNEMKNNIEKCLQQQQQTIVEDDNVQHPTTVMRTLVIIFDRPNNKMNFVALFSEYTTPHVLSQNVVFLLSLKHVILFFSLKVGLSNLQMGSF
jgi:hypothetical protein